jgi:hypothetical protein
MKNKFFLGCFVVVFGITFFNMIQKVSAADNIFSNVWLDSVSSNSVVIAFSTVSMGDSAMAVSCQIKTTPYGDSDSSTSSSGDAAGYVYSKDDYGQQITLNNLSANTKYNYVITCTDKNQKVYNSSSLNFTTLLNLEPYSGAFIKNISISSISSDEVNLVFDTGSSAKCYVNVNNNGGTLYTISTIGHDTVSNNGENHVYNIPGLKSNTKYFYVINCTDNGGNIYHTGYLYKDTKNGRFVNFLDLFGNSLPSVTTLINTNVVIKDSFIKNISSSDIKTDSAKISFNTNTEAKCKIDYSLEGGSIRGITEVNNEIALSSQHSITISGLSANTKYYYQIICTDKEGNYNGTDSLSSSGLNPDGDSLPTFTTMIIPGTAAKGEVIINNSVSNIKTDSISVMFDTTVNTECTIEYFLNNLSLGILGTDLNYNTKHGRYIYELSANTKYSYTITCLDTYGNSYKKENLSFTAANENNTIGLGGNQSSTDTPIAESINNFISSGVDANTQKLGSGERTAVINSYKAAFNKLPQSQSEMDDVIKIASGRWPSQVSQSALDKAEIQFKKIYKRSANTANPNDNAAITIMAYGLRQKASNRNLKSEAAGIKTFKSIYGHTPNSTEEWNILQAITYSGAKR